MRLLRYCLGRLVVVTLPPTQAAIELYVRSFAAEDGSLDRLTLDFGGRYIPLVSIDEARLAAALLAAYAANNTPIDTRDFGAPDAVEEPGDAHASTPEVSVSLVRFGT